jgi:hypothetical protein
LCCIKKLYNFVADRIIRLIKQNKIIELMFQKFIINREGVLKFGHVYLHRDMLAPGEQCTYGGGLWKIDEGRGAIVLYGRSFDFGPPDFDYVKQIDWAGLGGTPRPLLYLPHWPNEEEIVPIIVK